MSNFSFFESLKYQKAEEINDILLSKIKTDPSQPRKYIDEEKLKELADDIALNGLIQPILVRKDGMDYIIIAGERRYRAALLNSEGNPEATIPAIVKKAESLPKHDLGYLQMSENLKREDLKFYEIAEFISAHIDKGEAKGEIAKKLGISPQRISDYLAWIDAPEWLKELKDQFKSHLLFAQFAKQADSHSNELQSFLSELRDKVDLFSNADLNAFKASLVLRNNDPEEETELTSRPELEPEEELEEEPIQAAPEVDSDQSLASILDNDSVLENDLEHCNDDDESFSPSASQEEENAEADLAFPNKGEKSNANNETTNKNRDKDTLYKKPCIWGFVDGRSAELLYKVKAQDGRLMVEYSDGNQNEVLAEDFTITCIAEG